MSCCRVHCWTAVMRPARGRSRGDRAPVPPLGMPPGRPGGLPARQARGPGWPSSSRGGAHACGATMWVHARGRAGARPGVVGGGDPASPLGRVGWLRGTPPLQCALVGRNPRRASVSGARYLRIGSPSGTTRGRRVAAGGHGGGEGMCRAPVMNRPDGLTAGIGRCGQRADDHALGSPVPPDFRARERVHDAPSSAPGVGV